MLQRFVFLLFLLSTTNQELTTPTTPPPPDCPVYFLIDGSTFAMPGSDNSNIVAQIKLITDTTASLFPDHQITLRAAANIYGQLTAGEPDPSSLFNNQNDFMALISMLDLNYPDEDNIRNVISMMNDDEDFVNVMTIVFTNSNQTMIDKSDSNNYKALTYGVTIGNQDLSALTFDSMPLANGFGALRYAIIQFCQAFPTIPTQKASTELTTPTTPPPPDCPVFFLIDGSTFAMPGNDNSTVVAQIKLITDTTASVFTDHQITFRAAAGVYGQLTFGEPDPSSLVNNENDFLALINSMYFSYPDDDNIGDAISMMNDYHDFANVMTIVFTNSNQTMIDKSHSNNYKALTYGVTIGNQDLSALTFDSMPLANGFGALRYAIIEFCKAFSTIPTQKASTESTSIASTSTTPLILSCSAFFYMDGSKLGIDSYEAQKNLTLRAARDLFSLTSFKFSLGFSVYGQLLMGAPDVASNYGDYNSFEQLLDNNQVDPAYSETQTIDDAVNQMNDEPDFANTYTILFTNTDQKTIDASHVINNYYGQTIGVGVSSQNLMNFAHIYQDMATQTEEAIILAIKAEAEVFCAERARTAADSTLITTNMANSATSTQTNSNPQFSTSSSGPSST